MSFHEVFPISNEKGYQKAQIRAYLLQQDDVKGISH